MAWYRSDHEAQLEEWAHEEITLAEPFAAAYGQREMRRFDLLARVERDLGMPPGELHYVTERFIQRLIEVIATVWHAIDGKPSRRVLRNIIEEAIWSVPLHEDLELVLEDFGWDDDTQVQNATIHTFERQMRQAFIGRLVTRLSKLMRRLHRAEQQRTL